MRTTPIYTFINKLDREGRDPIDLLDEVESVLGIACAPVTWPIGMGKRLKGVYHMIEDTVYLYESGKNFARQEATKLKGLHSQEVTDALGIMADELREEIELVEGASHSFDEQAYLEGKLTPVFFGSAINNFGITPLLDSFVKYAPKPQPREAKERTVDPSENKLTGFVFKIQANMDPAHRDRVAFMRLCSGHFKTGMKIKQTSTGKDIKVASALTFMAADRGHVDEAWPGDIIGIHNHGTIAIGDTFTVGENLSFTGIPSFAPELFRRARLQDPLKLKALLKGLQQLSEEGATQFFKPIMGNDLVLGAVGILQFDVVAHRLKGEYNVEALFEAVQVQTARWVYSEDEKAIAKLKEKAGLNLAHDAHDDLVYLAPSRVNLQLTMERHPDVTFSATRELG